MSRSEARKAAAARRALTDESLVALERLLPDLDDDLPALRHRRRGRGVLTPDEIEQQFFDWSHRKSLAVYLERLNVIPSGPRSIPVDFTARDLRRAITVELIALENHVATQMPARPDASPARTLRAVRSLADGDSADDVARIRRLRDMLATLRVPQLEEEVADRAAEILDHARAAIDPPNFGQLGACPYCARKTLEVNFDKETITCTNGACRCPRGCAACRPPRPGQTAELHVWGRREWVELAKLCAAAEAAILDRMRRDAIENWIRRQMAVDESALVYESFTARNADQPHAEVDERTKALQAERAELENMTVDELKEFAVQYCDRDGYLEEWRP